MCKCVFGPRYVLPVFVFSSLLTYLLIYSHAYNVSTQQPIHSASGAFSFRFTIGLDSALLINCFEFIRYENGSSVWYVVPYTQAKPRSFQRWFVHVLTRCRAIAGRTARCRYRFRHDGIVRFLWHSTGFLYKPTSATVQMLKLHTVR